MRLLPFGGFFQGIFDRVLDVGMVCRILYSIIWGSVIWGIDKGLLFGGIIGDIYLVVWQQGLGMDGVVCRYLIRGLNVGD